jgi:hypothetical protein
MALELASTLKSFVIMWNILPFPGQSTHHPFLSFFLSSFFLPSSLTFSLLGFKLRALHLLGKCYTTWPMPPPLFCFSYFSDRALLLPGTSLRLLTSDLCLLLGIHHHTWSSWYSNIRQRNILQTHCGFPQQGHNQRQVLYGIQRQHQGGHLKAAPQVEGNNSVVQCLADVYKALGLISKQHTHTHTHTHTQALPQVQNGAVDVRWWGCGGKVTLIHCW